MDPSVTAYVGDDVPDIELMQSCEMGIAVSNAVAEVRQVADYVTQKRGGRGAVREVIEMLSKRR